MVYLKIKSNKKDIIKLYHNHNIIYLSNKYNYQIQLDFDIDNLYMEINDIKLIFNIIKFDIEYIKSINSKKFISIEKKFLNNILILSESIKRLPVIENHNYYLYFPKFKSLIPEWKSDTNIFYKISDFINLKFFRVGITNFKLLELFFNSEYIGQKLIRIFSIDISRYHITKPYTFRNIFIRRLKLELKSIYDNNIYSVASSRVHYFTPKYYSNIIIKDSKFNYKKIIKSDNNFIPKFIIVFRLAPQDYHHFYMPSTGKLLNYYYLGNDFQSVGYEFLYSKRFNPLNDNFRLVLEFEHINLLRKQIFQDRSLNSSEQNKFYLVIIGATIVGSIIVKNLIIGSIYKSKQYLGYFDLGGSCIVFMTNNKYNIRNDLISNSANNIETYFSVYDEINNIKTYKKNILPLIPYNHLILHKKILKIKIDTNNKSKFIIILNIFILLVLVLFIIKKYRK